VRPCFFQPPLGKLHAGGGGEFAGEAAEGEAVGGSLAAILNSPAAIAWRSGLDGARDEICRRCVCSLCLRQGDTGLAAEGGAVVERGDVVGLRERGARA
jgi:hypothetical protein